MHKNKKGFVLAITASLLPIILSGFLLAFSTLGFIKYDLALKYACRSSGVTGQKAVAPLLRQLLSLNTEALELRVRKNQLQMQIAAAAASGQEYMIPELELELQKVEALRMQLDIRQKVLIQKSNLSLKQAHQNGRWLIQKQSEAESSFFIQFNLKTLSGKSPRLAVRPDTSDIAPSYSLEPAFSERQALAHQWQYTLALKPPYSTFLPGRFEFEKACAVSLKEEVSQWSPQIIKGKFLSKSVW